MTRLQSIAQHAAISALIAGGAMLGLGWSQPVHAMSHANTKPMLAAQVVWQVTCVEYTLPVPGKGYTTTVLVCDDGHTYQGNHGF